MFDDMVAALQAVQAYDWSSFFHSRLDDYGQGKMVHSIDRAGYRLVFKDKPIGSAPGCACVYVAMSGDDLRITLFVRTNRYRL